MVSMATTNNKQPQAVFFKITSSLLKLANYGPHGNETLCAYVFHCFHDNHQQQIPSGTFPYNYFFTSQTCKPCKCMELKLGMHMYLNVSMTTIDKKLPQALFPVTTFSLLKLAQHTMRGNETWYACVFQRFHDNHEQKMASSTFFL